MLGFDVVIYPPGLEHAEHLDLRHRQEIICLWADTGPTPPFDHAIKLMDERGTLRSLFEMVYDEFTANRPCSAELISCYLQAIFLQVRQHFSEPRREASSLVERCLGYIHEHYARDFDIDELARQVAVSPSYLFRLFKKKMQRHADALSEHRPHRQGEAPARRPAPSPSTPSPSASGSTTPSTSPASSETSRVRRPRIGPSAYRRAPARRLTGPSLPSTFWQRM